MTDYTDPSTLNTASGDPITAELMTALKLNLVSFAEGDPTAPSVGPAIAAVSPGDVGSYVFAVGPNNFSDDEFGDTIAGSNLRPSCVNFGTGAAPYLGPVTGSDGGTGLLSGTWMCYGYSKSDGDYSMTLWLRIV